MNKKPFRVMVVDDSAFMRRFISDIIKKDRDLVLAGTARDGLDALKKREIYLPDVITLDVEMPRLDGLSTLKKIMENNPLPVVMVSTHTRQGSETTIEALAHGAVDFVTKPSLFQGESAEEIMRVLPEKLKAAAQAHLNPGSKSLARAEEVITKPVLKGDIIGDIVPKGGVSPYLLRDIPPKGGVSPYHLTMGEGKVRHAVAIGTSTGGPRALEELMRGLPGDLPAAFFITQHMPPGFTASLAQRLDRVSPLKVLESGGGEKIKEGEAYLAPGGYHLVVTKDYTTLLSSSPPVQHVRPSADVMMSSLAEVFGENTLGVILTGMGKDGAEGMARIKELGGRTIVQEPSTALIPSMPQAVIKEGLADVIVSLNQITGTIIRMLR